MALKMLKSQADPAPLAEARLDGASSADYIPAIEGVELTATSLKVTGDLPPGGWSAALRRLAPLERGTSWWLGDLLVYGGKDMYAVAAKETGFSTGSLHNLAYMSRRIPPDERRPDLPWRVHRVVAPLVPEERQQWLADTAERGWTSDELRRRIGLAVGGKPGGEFPDLLTDDGDDDAADGDREPASLAEYLVALGEERVLADLDRIGLNEWARSERVWAALP
jgi:hypothetical protein